MRFAQKQSHLLTGVPAVQDRDVLLRGMSPLPEDDLVLEGVVKVPGGRNGHQNIWDSAADIARPGTAAKTAAIAATGTHPLL